MNGAEFIIQLFLDKIMSDLNIENTERNITVRGKIDFIYRMLNLKEVNTPVEKLKLILEKLDFKFKQ